MVLFLFCFVGCKKKTDIETFPSDFESLMGKALPAWECVRTPEDMENLKFYKAVYEENISRLHADSGERKIPHVIHFIWVGPKAFPRESIENVRSWIGCHPEWEVKFWTDRPRPLPHPSMELCLVRDLPFQKLRPFYRRSDNYGEMSDLLRLEILAAEGGVYVDHDVRCLKSFAPFCQAYDLFCGMEVPFPSSLSSSLTPTNNTLGARPNHPLLMRCMEWLEDHWDQIEEAYPGRDRDATINRISHRTFAVLGKMFKECANQEGTIDIALPAYYFNSPKAKWALYAQHQYKGTWFDHETPFEKLVKGRLIYLSKKANRLLLAVGVLGGFSLLGFSLLGWLLLKRSRVVM